jgi:hypothetical protein
MNAQATVHRGTRIAREREMPYRSEQVAKERDTSNQVATHDIHVGNIGCPDDASTAFHRTPLHWCVRLMDYGDAVAF